MKRSSLIASALAVLGLTACEKGLVEDIADVSATSQVTNSVLQVRTRSGGMAGYEWWTWISGFAVFYVLSAILLAKATQTLPIGTAYPVWTGIGAVGAVLVGIFIFREPATFWRMFFLTTLIASIIGLKAIS